MTAVVSYVDRLSEVARDDWQALVNDDNPFVSYDYLNALEQTGATGEATGWSPHHALVHRGDALIGALPLYIKDDSWGEFVFDFAWAEAHHRHGIPYYPKLVTAVPFTPVSGPRLLGNMDDRPLIDSLLSALRANAGALNASSWHLLFATPADLDRLRTFDDIIIREDCQYHWHNQDYQSFDDFLAYFRSSRRKKTRRERRKVRDAGIIVETQRGADMTDEQWTLFYDLYASTFYLRGRAPYFQPDFFRQIAASDQLDMHICFARRDQTVVAASLFFVTADTLYGRYWGASEFIDGLHFELCYYQGIEYCIEHQIKRFDPGVQGEHKIARGFQATPSWSAHWLRHAPFAQAIADHVSRETRHVQAYASEVDRHLPFRRDRNTS
ncbi:MAG: GNAT family N-acetyltransferase [Pseudomonadota bacterium]